jgi:hypothetical protein
MPRVLLMILIGWRIGRMSKDWSHTPPTFAVSQSKTPAKSPIRQENAQGIGSSV